MDASFVERYQARMEGCAARADARIQLLKAESRTDEANLQKAGRNIYLVLAKVSRALGKPEAFLEKAGEMREAWEGARAEAQQHDDYERMAIEDVKLAALKEGLFEYESLREEVLRGV